MSTKWSHLPNAAHIDAVLASLKANPNEWGAAWGAARDVARGAAYDAAWEAAGDAAWYAIAALIAYNDCAYMLESDPDELRVLSKLGVDAATLMIPAAIAFKLIREKEKLPVD